MNENNYANKDAEAFSLEAINNIVNITSRHIEVIFDAHKSEDMAIRLCYAFLETLTAELISRALMISEDVEMQELFKTRIIKTAYIIRDIKSHLI